MIIYINRLHIHACHGVLPQEHIVGADFYVSLQVETEVQESALVRDQLEGTVDYALLVRLVQEEMRQPSQLLEHVAHRIAARVLKECPQISQVEVSVEKENPPLGVNCQGIGVKIIQKR